MINIVLICQFGASTGMLAENIKKAAADEGIEAVVNAYGVSEIGRVINAADIVLLGPQMRFHLDELKKTYADKNIPFVVINTMDYGMLNGKGVLDSVIKELNKN